MQARVQISARWPAGKNHLTGLNAFSACNARKQKMHVGQGCKICLLAKMKNLHAGILGAKSAFLWSANSASLLSAENARDSY
jgi:hypothetical protein